METCLSVEDFPELVVMWEAFVGHKELLADLGTDIGTKGAGLNHNKKNISVSFHFMFFSFIYFHKTIHLKLNKSTKYMDCILACIVTRLLIS